MADEHDLDHPRAPLAAFALDPEVLHLNHGSFGACPRAVLAAQDRVRARLERATMRYFVTEYPDELAAARATTAGFVGADPDGFVFVANATTGVATVLANLRLAAGDQVVVTDHAYRACRNALDRVAAAAGAEVVVSPIVTPVRDPDAPLAAILDRVTARTRLVLLDHVTSPTALVLDAAALARALPADVELLIDGAHVPGQLDLDVARLGATYYTGNFHKWTCAPKGAAFLWVAPARRDGFRPLVTSHGATLPVVGSSRFRLEHDWTGTHDPSTFLAVPAAIAEVAALGGGWPAVRARGRALSHAFADEVSARLGADPIAPPAMRGAMVALAVDLPTGADALAIERALLADGIELPVIAAGRAGVAPWSLVRFSAHLYNQRGDLDRALAALVRLGVRGRRLDDRMSP